MSIPLAVGVILLAGVIGGRLARFVGLPSVTGYLLAGVAIGPSVTGILPKSLLYELAPLNELALGVIAFFIGGELRLVELKKLGSDITKVFVFEAGLTFAVVFAVGLVIGLTLEFALVLAVLSIATAPGAILACVREAPVKGNFCRALLTVVALDNLAAIALFGILVSILQAGIAEQSLQFSTILVSFQHLLVAGLIGGLAGLALAAVLKWGGNESRILVITLGAILCTVGLANLVDVPSLLAAMVAGACLVNAPVHPQRVFRQLEYIEGPILVAFLTLAGVKLNLSAVPTVGLIGFCYVLGRFSAKITGSRIGAFFTQFPQTWQHSFGMALTPQAGVAIGLAVIAEQKLPVVSADLTTIILAAVVVFELIGPVLVRRALTVAEG